MRDRVRVGNKLKMDGSIKRIGCSKRREERHRRFLGEKINQMGKVVGESNGWFQGCGIRMVKGKGEEEEKVSVPSKPKKKVKMNFDSSSLKSICFKVGSHWYFIDPNLNSITMDVGLSSSSSMFTCIDVEMKPFLKLGYGCGRGIVALESKLYFIGGTSYRGDVHIYDTTTSSWRRGSPMKATGSYRVAIAVKPARIYTFGGSWTCDPFNCACYDTISDTWTSIPVTLPTSLIDPSEVGFRHAVHHEEQKTIYFFQSTGRLLYFMYDTGLWNFIITPGLHPLHNLIPQYTMASIFVQNYFLWYYCSQIFAYDLVHKQKLLLHTLIKKNENKKMRDKYDVEYKRRNVLVQLDSNTLALLYVDSANQIQCLTFLLRLLPNYDSDGRPSQSRISLVPSVDLTPYCPPLNSDLYNVLVI